MPRGKLIAALLALGLLQAGCSERGDDRATDSVTVKLPPAHAATARPGFRPERGAKSRPSGRFDFAGDP